MPLLQNGERFPFIEVPAVGGGGIKLPDALAGAFGVVLVYRGDWCPYCNAQLAAFEKASARFAEIGIKTIAFSVDPEATAKNTVARHSIHFPVGHSADLDQVVAALGCYTGDSPRCLQTTGFVLAPDGRVLNAVYSSLAIGRLVPDDVVGLVTYVKKKAAA
ncbi:MAG: peroxiredoxin family protein [Proteobacteria bacterium]|nr:peroxiredoxin family protein [Pseudomonadota bacterium]